MTKLVIPEFKGDYYFMSNFYAHEMSFTTADQPLKFSTAEHVFQACKYKAMVASENDKVAYVVKVAGAKTPTTARNYGKSAKNLDVDKWDDMKISVMREILMRKFAGTDLESRLLATGDAMLVEGNTWQDTYWGRCEGRGYNILGVLLMELRGYFRFCNGTWPVMQKDIDLPPY